MIEELFSILVKFAGAYLLAGLVVAVLFFTRWLKAFDPTAVGGSRGFRLLVTPGVVILWPVIMMKVFYQKPGADAGGAEGLRRSHRIAIVLLAIIGILFFTTALVWRAPALEDLPSVKIQDP